MGRALIELRSSSSTTTSCWTHRPVPDVPATQELLRRPFQTWGSGALIEQRWLTSKALPQGVRPFHSSWPRELASASKASEEAVSKVAGEDAKTAGEDAKTAGETTGKAVRGGPVSWASLALLVITGIGLILFWEQEKKRQLEALRSEKGAVATTGPGVGKAAIGGPFKLLNQDGEVVTDRDFVGNWTLIYFGFTYCPDICPDELTKLAEAIDKIEKKVGLQVLPVFISIDPERDTVEQIREYLKEYHPRFVGLTGTVEDIRQVAREYRVYYMKTEDEGEDYLVDHSIITYLMDPDMNFVKFFGKNYDSESLSEGVITEIKNILQKKKQ